jgi:probable dihydroxyacetone kinase regulator
MLKNTKAVFASSLKKMLEKKTLDHITVKDIVQDCGVSRQAFYYHFNDIYQLVEWIFKEETLEALADNRDIDTWQQGYRHILERMCQNKNFVSNVYRSISREYLERFMYNVLHDIIYPVVEDQAKGLIVDAKYKEFIAHFYSLAVVAMGMDWVRMGMKENPNEIAEKVAILVKGNFKKSLQEYSK